MSHERDSQRRKVYRAGWDIPRGCEFSTVREMQEYVNGITATRWWKAKARERKYWPEYYLAVIVKDGRGRRTAAADLYSNTIMMPRHSRCERTVIHELAHILTSLTDGSNVAPHGTAFAYNMLQLTRRFRGDDIANGLRTAYKEHGVRYYRRRLGVANGDIPDRVRVSQ